MATEAVEKGQVQVLRTALEKASSKLQAVAPKHLKVERVIRILLSAVSRNPKLAECSQESVLNFCMKCSETGLEPIGAGGAWPVPYKNKYTGKYEMQFIPDYRGLVNCAKRAECITDAWAEVVKEKDDFSYALGLDPTLTHTPATGDRGKLINAYCIFVFPDGSKRFVVMDKAEVEGIRKRSKASGDGPWVTDESEMWKKTVTRRAMKPFAGMSTALDAAIEADNDATGIDVDPIAMPVPVPKNVTAEGTVSEPLPADAKKKEKEAPAAAPEQPFDRTVAVAEIKALVDKTKASKCEQSFKLVGLSFMGGEDGKSWEMEATDTQLQELVRMFKVKA